MQLLVRVAEAFEKSARAAKAQADTESTARLESLEDLAIPRIGILRVGSTQVSSSSS